MLRALVMSHHSSTFVSQKKVEKSVIIMAKIQIKYDKYTAFSFYLENQRKAWRVVEKIVLLSAKACYEPKKKLLLL